MIAKSRTLDRLYFFGRRHYKWLGKLVQQDAHIIANDLGFRLKQVQRLSAAVQRGNAASPWTSSHSYLFSCFVCLFCFVLCCFVSVAIASCEGLVYTLPIIGIVGSTKVMY